MFRVDLSPFTQENWVASNWELVGKTGLRGRTKSPLTPFFWLLVPVYIGFLMLGFIMFVVSIRWRENQSAHPYLTPLKSIYLSLIQYKIFHVESKNIVCIWAVIYPSLSFSLTYNLPVSLLAPNIKNLMWTGTLMSFQSFNSYSTLFWLDLHVHINLNSYSTLHKNNNTFSTLPLSTYFLFVDSWFWHKYDCTDTNLEI